MAFPKHLAISNPYTAAFWEHFKADLEGYKISESAIRIPHNRPLPEKLTGKIVEFWKKENLAALKATR